MRGAKSIGFIITLLLLCSSRVFAQNDYDKVWVQGGSMILKTTFTSGNVVNSILDTGKHLFVDEGGSNICDSLGNLILISDGYRVYDKYLNLLDNGDSITPKEIIKRNDGSSPYSQSSIFLPIGGNKYYFITPTVSDQEALAHWVTGTGRAVYDELYYNVIDMNVNAGAGKVTRKMVRILQNAKLSKTQMMACRHADGKAWWVLKQAVDTNIVYKFLFTKDSVYAPTIQSFAEPHGALTDNRGQSVFSKDGTKYATTCQGWNKIFIADFDRCYGTLSNPKVYDVPVQPAHNPGNPSEQDDNTNGLVFSPNGRFLYVNGYFNVQQLDLQDGNMSTAWSAIGGLDTTWAASNGYTVMYLAPNNKIYVGNFSNAGAQMSAIDNPDSKGLAANFCPKCLRFPPYVLGSNSYYFGVMSPPCMPNYHLGKSSNFCWPAGIEETSKKETEFSIYPNPSTGTITIKYSESGRLEIIDMLGWLQQSIILDKNRKSITVELGSLPTGIYTYRQIKDGMQLHTGKLVIMH